jgi:hypothetical protein
MKWCRKWDADVAARKEKHAKEDKAKKAKEKSGDKAKNPWDRVLGNIESKESATSGSKDITRMRQVILGRKSDVKK